MFYFLQEEEEEEVVIIVFGVSECDRLALMRRGWGGPLRSNDEVDVFHDNILSMEGWSVLMSCSRAWILPLCVDAYLFYIISLIRAYQQVSVKR